MNIAECPSCGTLIEIGQKPKMGQQVTCTACDTVLEVVWLDPLELDWVYDDEDEEYFDEGDYELEDSDY